VSRTRNTLSLYAGLGCLGYLLTGLGAILPQLRSERGLSRVEVGLYPSAFALGLIIVGVAGHHLSRLLGRHAVPTALTFLGAGAVILAAGTDRVVTGAGALVLGIGGAGLVQLVPAALRAEHGDPATAPISEANAVASSASVLAPLVVGAALAGGLGWRPGYLVLPLVAVAALLITLTRPRAIDMPSRPAPTGGDSAVAVDSLIRTTATASTGRRPAEFAGWWLDLVLVVAVEFCVLFWAADFLHTESGIGADAAITVAAAFVLGMAIGRAAIGPVTRLVTAPVPVLAGSAGLATAGFALFWAGGPPAVAVAGLAVTGLGVALLYPVTLAQTLAAWPDDPSRAAARCALASGVAIGAAPVLLGTLADAADLRVAVLLTPSLLLVFLIRCATRLGRVRSSAS
jgi:fucose permease